MAYSKTDIENYDRQRAINATVAGHHLEAHVATYDAQKQLDTRGLETVCTGLKQMAMASPSDKMNAYVDAAWALALSMFGQM